MDNIKTVIAFFRGQGGITVKQAIKALLALISSGVDQMPDTVVAASPTQPLAIVDAEGAIKHLENAAASGCRGPQGMIALPWATLVPIFMELLQKWMGNLGTAKA